ncbi:MFS transporter [Rhodococcus qingshengii]|uniref:MFS transporter n=1 Tax=Rhodococcus qingshengii TaxID=334542 RepID=A0AAW6LVW3_RHOSG|nr:MFS transporter [Rhodococcus qingshengii]
MSVSKTPAILAVLTVGVGSFTLLQSMVAPVLPTLQAELGASQADSTWIVIVYLLSAAVCTPIIGRAGDLWGRRRLLIFCLTAIAVGALLSSLAASLPLMIIGRAIQGIGGGVLPISFGIIRAHFPDDAVPGSIGLIASISAVWAGVGVVIGGPLVEHLGYRWLFWVPTILLVVSIAATLAFIPRSTRSYGGRLNILSSIMMSAWLLPLLVGATKLSSWGWRSPSIVALLAASAVFAAVWIVFELHSENPLVDIRVMRIREIWVANLASLLFGAGMFGAMAFLPALVQTPSTAGYGLGLSPSEAGLLLLSQTVSMFVVGLFAGRLTAKYGARRLLATGSLICALGFFSLATGGDSLWKFVVTLGVVGVGFSLAFTSMSNMVVAAAPRSQTSVASGMNVNLRNIGGALGTALMAMFVSSGVSPDTLPKEWNYSSGFLALGVLLFIGATVVAVFAHSRGVVPTEVQPSRDPALTSPSGNDHGARREQ